MIAEKEKSKGWKFMFLGADLANFNDAQSIGVHFHFKVDKENMKGVYANLSHSVSAYASTGNLSYDGTDYKKKG